MCMVTAVHERGLLLGDLSPRNILINPTTLKMWFIDFESSVLENEDAEVVAYATQWGTAGFMNPVRASRNELLQQDDLYALAMTL
jgi:aminoglycoside phosphotransferase (APT) family kinase protein